MWKVCIVIPTKNEEKTIEGVIDAIDKAIDRDRFVEPVFLVVDDSTDGTRRLAREAGARVVIGRGQGLGSAMFIGLKTAAALKPDFIVTIDGDGQADAEEIPRFLGVLEDDEADLVLGSRFLDKESVKYRYRWINRLGTRVLSWMLRRFTKTNVTDSHGGIRAMRREVAEEVEMLGTHTYVQETIIDAAEKGFRIKEIPSAWKKREHGKSRVVGSIPRYIFYTLPVLFMRSGQHIRALFTLGILLVIAAMAYFTMVLWESGFNIKETGKRVPAFVFITMLISLGFNFFFFGLVLQMLKQMKYRLDRTVEQRRIESAWPDESTRSRKED